MNIIIIIIIIITIIDWRASVSDYWSWGREFDSRHLQFPIGIRSETWSIQSRKDNWVATWLRSSRSD